MTQFSLKLANDSQGRLRNGCCLSPPWAELTLTASKRSLPSNGCTD